MSLITDSIGLGAALAVAVGSAVQASQAFAELNAETPLKTTPIPLIWAALKALFKVVIARTNVDTMGPILVNLGLATQKRADMSPEDLKKDLQDDPKTPDWVKNTKKWLGLFLGWFFISLGALAALAAAVWTLVNDL